MPRTVATVKGICLADAGWPAIERDGRSAWPWSPILHNGGSSAWEGYFVPSGSSDPPSGGYDFGPASGGESIRRSSPPSLPGLAVIETILRIGHPSADGSPCNRGLGDMPARPVLTGLATGGVAGRISRHPADVYVDRLRAQDQVLRTSGSGPGRLLFDRKMMQHDVSVSRRRRGPTCSTTRDTSKDRPLATDPLPDGPRPGIGRLSARRCLWHVAGGR